MKPTKPALKICARFSLAFNFFAPHFFVCHFLALCFALSILRAEGFAPLLLSEFEDSAFDTSLLVSEKLDGVRGLWDGKQMYFRSGRAMNLPSEFVRDFPPFALDGELYARGRDFGEIISIVKNPARVSEVQNLRYFVFDVPRAQGGLLTRLEVLEAYLRTHPNAPISIIPQSPESSLSALYKRLDSVVDGGGEGLVLRASELPYQAGRSKRDFKLKRAQDSECEVIAHTQGKGKYAGMLGALVCQREGKSFKIGSGLSDEMRRNPPPIGTLITFKYHALTPNGVPRFPRFWRIKEAE